MTPFIAPETGPEEKYNKALTITRARVEHTFGVLKNRFRSLIIPLRIIGAVRSCKVVTAMMVLHNIAIRNRDKFEALPEGLDPQGTEPHGDNTNQAGQNMRHHYVNAYFS